MCPYHKTKYFSPFSNDRRKLCTFVLLQILTTPLYAILIHVPADYPEIQDAINAASNGDVIAVAPGTYQPIDFFNKHLEIYATDPDPSNTIITGGGIAEHVVTVVGGQTLSNSLTRFTITGGHATGNGGGVYVNGSRLLLKECKIVNNHADGNGGGIYIIDEVTSVIDCFIGSNNADGDGGGIAMSNAFGNHIASNEFSNNVSNNNDPSAFGGGAIFMENAQAYIKKCHFNNNTGHAGGAITTYLVSESEISGCTFNNNHSLTYGGAIYCISGSHPDILRCWFEGNSAVLNGGALSCDTGCSPYVESCGFFNNSANSGAAVDVYNYGGPYLYCCTIAYNNALIQAGAIINDSNADTWTTNCIIYGNTPVGSDFVNINSATHLIKSSIFDNPFAPGWDPQIGQDGGNNIVNIDPLFENGATGNFNLKLGSNAIDSGDSSILIPPPPPEGYFDGNNRERIVDHQSTSNSGPFNPGDIGPVDMGCFEFNPCSGNTDNFSIVNLSDLANIADRFGDTDCGTCGGADLNGDNNVGTPDLLIVAEDWTCN